MPAHVTIKLTLNEALAFARAASNSTSHDDVMDSIFDGDKVGKRAAYRASSKLDMAIGRKLNEKSSLFCAACKGHGRDVKGPGNQNFGCPKCGLTKGDVGPIVLGGRNGGKTAAGAETTRRAVMQGKTVHVVDPFAGGTS
jgi:hypothetical protein